MGQLSSHLNAEERMAEFAKFTETVTNATDGSITNQPFTITWDVPRDVELLCARLRQKTPATNVTIIASFTPPSDIETQLTATLNAISQIDPAKDDLSKLLASIAASKSIGVGDVISQIVNNNKAKIQTNLNDFADFVLNTQQLNTQSITVKLNHIQLAHSICTDVDVIDLSTVSKVNTSLAIIDSLSSDPDVGAYFRNVKARLEEKAVVSAFGGTTGTIIAASVLVFIVFLFIVIIAVFVHFHHQS